MQTVRATLLRHLDELDRLPVDQLLAERREKFRRMASIEGRFPVLS
jgi:acetyl-CoA carboxylase alpha subunit